MSNLDDSSSITTKFLLGKSFKEVILLFVPQMVTAIWVDDIICSTCSETLHTFARFIEEIISTEKVLKNYNKRITNARRNTKVESTVINRESSELNPHYENKMQLQLRPIQELEEGPMQSRINEDKEYSHEQSKSSSQNDLLKKPPIKWVKCRTCLLEMLDLEPSAHLKEKFILDKTFKEVILYFIPHLVSAYWIEEIICAKCSKILSDFAVFIEKCVAIEEIFKKADIKIEDEFKINEVENQLNENAVSNPDLQIKSESLPSSPDRKWWSQSKIGQDSQKVPDQLNFNSDNLKRTYSRKPKIKEVVELSVKKEPPEPPLLNITSTNSVEKFTINCQKNPIETPLPTAVNDCIIEISDEDEETRKPPVQPIVNYTSGNQGYSRNISTIKLSNTDEEIVQPNEKESHFVMTTINQEKSLDDKSSITLSSDRDVKPVGQRNRHYETNGAKRSLIKEANRQNFTLDRPSSSSTASDRSDNVNPIHNLEVPIVSIDESEDIDINKQFNFIKGDSIYNYPIHLHDRVVSISQSKEVFPTFLEYMSSRDDILMYHYGVPNNTVENKRVLLLGLMMVPCPICNVEFSRTSLRTHMTKKHNAELPRFKNDASYSCVLRPTKKGELPRSENNLLYIYDYIFKPTNSYYTHPCPHCKTITYSKSLLKRHIQRVHKDFKAFKCKKCGKMFRWKANYTAHLKKFHDYPNCNLRKCDVCSEMISNEIFVKHVKAHQLFICDECGISCLSAYYLRKHTRVHHIGTHKQKRKRKFIPHQQLCPICGKLATNMAFHKTTHEPRPGKYMCHKCPKFYRSINSLKLHIKYCHHDEVFECKECRKTCRSIVNLREHIKLKHSKTYVHSCKICGKRFSRADYLERHMKYHSGGECVNRKYLCTLETIKCKYCLKLFKTVPQLRYHLQTHIKRKRYKCRICAITCSSLQSRHRHEKKHKDPTFEFRCKICWNEMKTKEQLEKHMVKHEMSKKYRCPYCVDTFARRYLLSHHISEEHTNEDEVEKEKRAIFSDALEEFLI